MLTEPTLRALPADRITTERDTWRAERDTRTRDQYALSARRDADTFAPFRRYEHHATRSRRPHPSAQRASLDNTKRPPTGPDRDPGLPSDPDVA